MPKGGELIVFGSLNMDISVSCDRFPAPGETVFGRSVIRSPGGKGLNQAVAAARYGGLVEMIGAVGTDDAGAELIACLEAEHVAVHHVRKLEGESTGAALITVAEDGGNTIVVVPGANAKAAMPARLTTFNPVGLAQFEVPLLEIENFYQAIHREKGRTILNPSPFQPIPETLLSETDILIVNEVELAQMTGATGQGDSISLKKTLDVLNRPGQTVIVTMGSKGCLYHCNGDMEHVPAEPVSVVDTTGAGDCFAGVFAASLAQGRGYPYAVHDASVAAALSTTRRGAAASMPTERKIREYVDALSR